MRILLAGQTYRPPTNGAAVFMINLAEGLAKAGHAVTALAPSHRWSSQAAQHGGVCLLGIRAFRLPPFEPPVRVTLAARRGIVTAVRRIRPQVVHLFDHYPLSRAALSVALEEGVPVLASNLFLPGNIIPPTLPPGLLRELLERVLWGAVRAVMDRVTLVTVPTGTAAAIVRAHGLRAPVQVISCGVDLERFRLLPGLDRQAVRHRYGLDGACPLLLYLGRLDPEKRLDILLQALARLPVGAWQVAIAGRGRQTASLQGLASRLGLAASVRWLGYVPEEDLTPLLNSADAFVMPGEAELQSLVTLQAMACGRPIVAAAACALPELVRHGDNGYLFRAGDAGDLACALARLLTERDRWPGMGDASLSVARQHDMKRTIARYEETYQQFINHGDTARWTRRVP